MAGTTAGTGAEAGLGPLTADEVALISSAAQRARAATRAAALASVHGWSFAVCALLCAPFAVADPWLLLVGLALGVIAWIELRGARMLRAFQTQGTRMLAFNQLALLVLVWIYCGLSLWGGLTGPSVQEQMLAEAPDIAALVASGDQLADLQPMFDHIDHIYRLSLVALYGGVAIASLLYQGLCAFYYWSRAAHLSAYLRETPSWVRDLLLRMQR